MSTHHFNRPRIKTPTRHVYQVYGYKTIDESTSAIFTTKKDARLFYYSLNKKFYREITAMPIVRGNTSDCVVVKVAAWDCD